MNVSVAKQKNVKHDLSLIVIEGRFLTRFRPFIKYDTLYNRDIYQDNACQNTILTVRLFIKFNTFYHNDNYNA
jgi:hypothetical protein